MKIRVGILFGGISREREVSFAGGRTVYDNLDKSLFEAIPFFVDSFGNLVKLRWDLIYKGSIRDFYPPVDALPPSEHAFQVYAESLELISKESQIELLKSIGEPIEWKDLSSQIDFAFLCLHGAFGEDGQVQTLLEGFQIPYSGSGIKSSAIGMNKALQKELMKKAHFPGPEYLVLKRRDWLSDENKKSTYEKVKESVKIPFMIKSSNQGSSIGAGAMLSDDLTLFIEKVNRSFFIQDLSKETWTNWNEDEQMDFISELCDIRVGIGLPLSIHSDNRVDGLSVYHPEMLWKELNRLFAKSQNHLQMRAFDGETEVLMESFIEGKEFSCIVIRKEDGTVTALPPTEIIKGIEVFDYRSKYLPGLSRKITPINIADDLIRKIASECCRLYAALNFNVYARIDGFIKNDGTVLLNDPNTTSGMLPSSFFFHQAAEIGLNPSQFLSFIVRTSMAERQIDYKSDALKGLLNKLDEAIGKISSGKISKQKVAVILGGYSFERHISVESGRNVYEKLSSSEKYEPIPVFLTGNRQSHSLYVIPVNILLKDNADDIREKIIQSENKNGNILHSVLKEIREQCKDLTQKYAASGNLDAPRKITYEDLAKECTAVFIALHGRPGEDGEVQRNLERVHLPYNGSGPASSSITIDKFETNELLMKNGFLVAKHELAHKENWSNNKADFSNGIMKTFTFPFIAKPVDDGCSAAVLKIKNAKELEAYADLVFRDQVELNVEAAKRLGLKWKEEFPLKDRFLIEELISSKGAKHFLEITCGLLTHYDENGNLSYEVFEPSEALSGGEVLSLEEKFLAGEGQNITPARFSKDKAEQISISSFVKTELEKAAKLLNIQGYARIDAFVRIAENTKAELIFVEVNSLPGMTPATCIFHQCAINGYKPYEFINTILDFGAQRLKADLVKN